MFGYRQRDTQLRIIHARVRERTQVRLFHRLGRPKVKPTGKAKLNGDWLRGNERTSSSDVVPVR